MPVIQLNPIVLLAPAFLIGAYIGYRRGWATETLTTVGLAIAIALLWRGPATVVGFLNSVLAVLVRALAVITGGNPGRTPPTITVSPALEPVVTIGLLTLLVVGAYLLAGRYGRRFRLDRAARWYGALVGGLNLFILMSRIVGNLRQDGPTPPGVDGLNIRIPSFPGLTIVVPSPPEGALLVNWPLAAAIFLLVSMLVYALVRMARA